MYMECQFGQQARVIAAARQHVRNPISSKSAKRFSDRLMRR
jgi:hypothetical protein